MLVISQRHIFQHQKDISFTTHQNFCIYYNFKPFLSYNTLCWDATHVNISPCFVTFKRWRKVDCQNRASTVWFYSFYMAVLSFIKGAEVNLKNHHTNYICKTVRLGLCQLWWVCWTVKSDLSSTTKWDQNNISHICKFGCS